MSIRLGPPIPKRKLAGSTLLLVLFLASIAGIAVMTFFNTVRQERGRAARVLQRTRGQAMARRVVMRIAGLVQQKPWSDRFFKEKPVRVYSSEGAFREDGPEFRDGGVRYEGEVKQLSALNKWFRIKLRVVYPSGSFATKDYAYNSAWDLRYSEGILGAMNRCNVLASAETDDIDAPEDQLDQELDFIKQIARGPEKDPQIGGTDAKPWMDDVRGAEGKGEDTKATDLARPPTDLLNPPPWVDGQSDDPLGDVRKWIDEAIGGQPGWPPPPPPTPTPEPTAPTTPTPPAATLADLKNWGFGLREKLRTLGLFPTDPNSDRSQWPRLYGQAATTAIHDVVRLIKSANGDLSQDICRHCPNPGGASQLECVRANLAKVKSYLDTLPQSVRDQLPTCPF